MILRAARAAIAVCVLAPALPAAPADPPGARPEWTIVEYGEIVDRRQPTHSGEPVGLLLDRLDGRALPPPGERPADRLDHTLLDPWMEPYAFVLPDTIDALEGVPERPFSEIAWRWAEGEAQPAWVELLRARRYVVESDGAGRVRVFAPLSPPFEAGIEDDARRASRVAWESARPVLRHALAAIRLSEAPDGPLRVDVYPFVHRPERTSFALGLRPYRVDGDAAAAVPGRPAIDLEAWDAFLDAGVTLEGARLEPDGTVRPFGSRRDGRPTLAGEPVGLADLAVAYRAVFHGGLAEPYMSLDRGYGPETSVVNYGGRLRDTRLGEVALRCDIRFKTFSVGQDVLTGRDVRARVRESLPGFRSHLERFAADPQATGVLAQQTRLWFYPDAVDLTLSPQADVLALRRVRMSAASERLAEGDIDAAAGGEAPWTRRTVEAVNRDYDALAALFPELEELDQAVRLLALFTWLRQAGEEGLLLPDLDALLAVELPGHRTPRRFPRLLSFNALPPPAAPGEVVVHDRQDAWAALARLRPSVGELGTALARYRRAVARLDESDPVHRRLMQELARHDAAALSEVELDFLAYRAERVAMHRLVMDTLPLDLARPLAERARGGEDLRVFSVAIGGLDLGMGNAVRAASRRSLTFGAQAGTGGRPSGRRVAPPGGGERVAEPPGASPPVAPMPPPARASTVREAVPGDAVVWRTIAAPHGPGARLREGHRRPSSGAPVEVVRHERGTTYRYRVDRSGAGVRLRPAGAGPAAAATPEVSGGAVPVVRLDGSWRAAGGATAPERARPSVRVEARQGDRESSAEVPRDALRDLLLGPGLGAGRRTVEADLVLPAGARGAARVLVAAGPVERLPPWRLPSDLPAPEEESAKFAGGLRRAREATGRGPAVAVALRADAGARWSGAPDARKKPALLLPDGTFGGERRRLRDDIEAAWGASARVVSDPGAVRSAGLVVLVSDEPSDLLAARAVALAADPRMAGRMLAVVSAGGPARPDLPARLLEAGGLAGVAVHAAEPTGVHALPDWLRAFAAAASSAGKGTNPADLDAGPLWYF